jgi:hypothetical protein
MRRRGEVEDQPSWRALNDLQLEALAVERASGDATALWARAEAMKAKLPDHYAHLRTQAGHDY